MMPQPSRSVAKPSIHVVKPFGEQPIFKSGDAVRISLRYPIGHYRVPRYIRSKRGVIESVIDLALVNNEEEGFGRNAGSLGYYYRVAIPLVELWPGYTGSQQDNLRIEVFETWLERS
jgi:nitrile hydratase subunit beta